MNFQFVLELSNKEYQKFYKILFDYDESVGNRVLTIDDISGLFNNNARTDRFMSVDTFTLANVRYRKYITIQVKIGI